MNFLIGFACGVGFCVLLALGSFIYRAMSGV